MLLAMLMWLVWLGSGKVGMADSPRPGEAIQAAATPEAVFEEAWSVVRIAFYDPNLNGVDWQAVREELRPRAREAKTGAELSAVINDALGRLKASHTRHYHQDQREYYELLDVFNPDGVPARDGSLIKPGRVEYVGIGLATATIDGRTFASDVYSDGPACKGGVLPGDELIGVEDGPWGDIAPFRDRAGKPTRVIVQRTSDPASKRELLVTPERIQPREMFLAAQRASARIIELDGKRAGYVRVRSYANEAYHDLLKELVAEKFQEEGLPLIVDLRGGWGGARPSYMDVFNPTVPRMTFIGRDGDRRDFVSAWPPRRMVMLIDGGSRSGKEVLAYAFKKHRVGMLVGERTAGAVLAGSPRPLADGSVLYVAVSKVLVDAEVIEGVGVSPDVLVERKLPYSAGGDAQVDAAIRAAHRKDSP